MATFPDQGQLADGPTSLASNKGHVTNVSLVTVAYGQVHDLPLTPKHPHNDFVWPPPLLYFL